MNWKAPKYSSSALPQIIGEYAEDFGGLAEPQFARLLERIGDSRIVLLGEATHGTHEFYEFRARLTEELVKHKGFRIIALEADWPDAQTYDEFIQGTELGPSNNFKDSFDRFPSWMWKNKEYFHHLRRLKRLNENLDSEDRAHIYGLDLYSMYDSVSEVIRYLDRADPHLAQQARAQYSCLQEWRPFASDYGRDVLRGLHPGCEDEVVQVLKDLLDKRSEDASWLSAAQNAKVVAAAERYYRMMYHGSAESWNLRDQHMYNTLVSLLDFHGEDSKAVVWAHNSHIGDASATEMGKRRGEINIGYLCRQGFGDQVYSCGFGTDTGDVIAAAFWEGPTEVQQIRPSRADSLEARFHMSGKESCQLPLRYCPNKELKEALDESYLQRAIGVIYRPDTELQSHYFEASAASQFDEYIWFDRTRALEPIGHPTLTAVTGLEESYPSGL